MAARKKATKSKRKTARPGGSKAKSLKKRMIRKTGKPKKAVRKINERQSQASKDIEAVRTETLEIEDSGAVQEARSSVENIVQDAKKTVEDTTQPVV